MKKIFNNPIFTFVLGAIIFSTLSVFAYSLIANDVGFTPTDSTWKKIDGSDIENVSEALDDLYDQVKIEDYTASFYLCGDTRTNYARYAYFDVNVAKYNKFVLNVSYVYTKDTSVFTFKIIVDGVDTLNIKATGTYTLDVTNKSNVRLYYYENSGYVYTAGTYTLKRY